MNEADFINEYIDRLNEEVNSLMKEKIIFRAQIGLLQKTVAELEASLSEKQKEIDKLIAGNEKKKSKQTDDQTF